MMFWRKKKSAAPAGPTVPATKEVLTDAGKIQALDFGSDAQQCFAYLKAALRKENTGTACFLAAEVNPALWTLLSKAHITGRVWTKDARIGKKQVSLFKPIGVAF
jgi:hypothetical protein